MKKICFLIGNINHSGGTERVTSLIANKLSENDYKIFILSLAEGKQPFFPLEENVEIYSLFPEKISMRKNYINAIRKIREFCKKNHIDILVVVDSISCVFTVPALYGLNIKHICWEHFNLTVDLGSQFRNIGRWMAAKWCDKIVTLTERDRKFWEEKFKLADINKVISIANPSPFLLQETTPRLEYKNILCVGRLTYQKGFDLLIPAWAKIANTLPDWKITIVGTGEDEQRLKRMAKEYKVEQSIDFVGQQKNMDEFYKNASFFCMSSRFEGLPMVLLEAQSYGLPIVSFDCDTGPSEIISNGINGFLVSYPNKEDLANKILEMTCLKKDYYNDLVENSKEAIKKFNLELIIKDWKNLSGYYK